MAPHVLAISASLNPGSRSRILARAAAAHLESARAEVDFLDLREVPLPFCDGSSAYDHESLPTAAGRVEAADAILVAAPIYNFDLNAAVKNFLEMTGRSWTGKIVGFLCAAGGRASYMSVMSFAGSLMLDFRCLILPRFVYATKGDFADGGIASEAVTGRIRELCDETVRIAGALAG